MSISRLTPTLFLLFFLSSNILLAQKVDEKAEPSQSDAWITTENGKVENFPIHVTDILLEQPGAKEALQQFRERKEQVERGYRVQSFETTQAEIGDEETFKVNNFETESFDDVEFVLMAVGDISEIWVEIDELSPDKITQEVIDEMMNSLEVETQERSFDPDRGIIEINREIFGDPPDVDNSGKVKVLLTNIQDSWEPGEGGGFIAGFFHPIDLSLTDSNSNKADIIYINTFPGIYTEDLSASTQSSLNTIAHEYQHLIHSNYGYLSLFQNEGQSELAELLNGFNARPMAFLNIPEEVGGTANNTGLFDWREGEEEVLRDYERAGLLHSYLNERVGPYEAGSLTRANVSGRRAYENVLQSEGIEWEIFLSDFYIANWLNDTSIEERFGYSLPQLSSVQVSNPAISLNSSTNPTWLFNEEVTIGFGGAKYINWFGVKDLELDINADEGLRHYIISRKQGDLSNSINLITPDNVPEVFEDIYEAITLISINTALNSNPETNNGNVHMNTFSFNADWERTDIAQREYRYYSETGDRFFTNLLGDDGEIEISLRFTPEEPGNISTIHFVINDRSRAVQGDGTLKISLSESQSDGGSGGGAVLVPADEIASKDVPFSNLATGENYVTVNAPSWEVSGDEDFHVSFEIVNGTANANLEFLIDEGTTDETDSNYFPARTRVFVSEDSPMGSGWFRYGENNNLLASINLIYADDSLTNAPDSAPPYADSFELEQNYPNPFNPRTVIRYNLVDDVPVRLEVFDILGRKIQTLVDEDQIPGAYEIPFDGTGLSSGIYVYRLIAGDYIRSNKMILAK